MSIEIAPYGPPYDGVSAQRVPLSLSVVGRHGRDATDQVGLEVFPGRCFLKYARVE